jgi:hypothetical protein
VAKFGGGRVLGVRALRDYVQRQSQSPTSQAINQLVKGCQMAMHSAVILARENQRGFYFRYWPIRLINIGTNQYWRVQ